jgi:hypothetical protein
LRNRREFSVADRLRDEAASIGIKLQATKQAVGQGASARVSGPVSNDRLLELLT